MKQLKQQLGLNKETISSLTNENQVKGGSITVVIASMAMCTPMPPTSSIPCPGPPPPKPKLEA